MVEAVIGCKWSLTVLALVGRGVCRPGAMRRAAPGLSAKVLNERLTKLTRFGVLAKRSHAEIPPRVEYSLTPFGTRFIAILDAIDSLDRAMERPSVRRRPRVTARPNRTAGRSAASAE